MDLIGMPELPYPWQRKAVDVGVLAPTWFQEGPEILPFSTARKVLADDSNLAPWWL